MPRNDHYLDRAYRARAGGGGRKLSVLNFGKKVAGDPQQVMASADVRQSLYRSVGVRPPMLETRALPLTTEDFQRLYGSTLYWPRRNDCDHRRQRAGQVLLLKALPA